MTPGLAQTPLHDWHLRQGGRMVDFAGWSMPVQYTSIVEEHTATRTAATVFDVSHMGRLRIEGDGAAAFLDRILTRRVLDLQPGRIRYGLVTNEAGGILDDVLVYHQQTPSGRQYFLLVVNASNREKILGWLSGQLTGQDEVAIWDRTLETAMIAVQGPRAIEIVDSLVDTPVHSLKYYQGTVTQCLGRACTVSRTGYTGEDGCELIVRSEDAQAVVQNVFLAGREAGIRPAGLAARDTLRLEAAMPLYGHELSEEIDPFQAGLDFAVQLTEGRQFVGSQALRALRDRPDYPRRVGLLLDGQRPAREGYAVRHAGQQVGEVTSGTFSPTLARPIAMAYVQGAQLAQLGTQLEVDVRGRLQPAQVVALPFYRRA